MGAIKGFAARIRALLFPRTTERALNEEIEFHLEQETEKNVRLGLSRDEARRQALIQFGGLTQTREAHHDVYAARPVEELMADTRYTLRTMRRTPALAGAAILTLALGVGANTAIFSAVNAVILQPLPFPKPDQLYMVWEENPEKGWYKQVAAPANMLDWKQQVGAFADVMAYSEAFGTSTLLADGEPVIVRPAFGTGNFFSVLGVRAALGRTFLDAETWRTGQSVAVLSHRLCAIGSAATATSSAGRYSWTGRPCRSSGSCRRASRIRARTWTCGSRGPGIRTIASRCSSGVRTGSRLSRA